MEGVNDSEGRLENREVVEAPSSERRERRKHCRR